MSVVRIPANPDDSVELAPYVNFNETPDRWTDPEHFEDLYGLEEEDEDEAYERERQEEIDSGICTDPYELLDIQEEQNRE